MIVQAIKCLRTKSNIISTKKITRKRYKVINLRLFLIGSSSDLTPTSLKLEKPSAQTHDVSKLFFIFFYNLIIILKDQRKKEKKWRILKLTGNVCAFNFQNQRQNFWYPGITRAFQVPAFFLSFSFFCLFSFNYKSLAVDSH